MAFFMPLNKFIHALCCPTIPQPCDMSGLSGTPPSLDLVGLIKAHLQDSSQSFGLSEERQKSVQLAIECLDFAFGPAQPPAGQDLDSIYNAFLQSLDDLPLTGEEYKTMGNEMMRQRNYQEAIKLYSNAIRKDASNHVYYANRAAAYVELEMGQQALSDCNEAIRIDPDYIKGYSRKGAALMLLGRRDEALEAFQYILSVDPLHEYAEAKVKELTSGSGAVKPSESQSKSPFENMLGSANLSQLLNNPQLMNMASQYFGNMSTEGTEGNAQPSSGNPLANLLSNPELMKMAQNFMSSDKNKKPEQ